jgi:phosphopantothenoylcysteine decarboxylase/phosphopantothenate--cysteine ligase
MAAGANRRLRVLLGITGGIAAYKSLELARLFRKAGCDVVAVMTEAARKFVGPESFRALTGNPVATELFPRERPRPTGPTGRTRPTSRSGIGHIDLATSADLVVVAPATANIIGKLASGIADDLLSTVLLAIPAATVKAGRVIFAPAMNTNMWQNPAVGANVSRLSRAGYRFVSPGSGELACGTTGPGRMAEPAVIFDSCRSALAPRPSSLVPRLASGVRVLITAGRTEESIDPVRVITNRSSGRMGIELARAFQDAGADVTLIAGELSVPAPAGIRLVRSSSTESMLKAVLAELPGADALVMCAAVADYRPARVSRAKAHDGALTLDLVRTPDILKEVSRRRHRAVVIGFSLDDDPARARAKLADKKLDLVVANPFRTVGSDRVAARLIFRGGRTRALKPMRKEDFARLLVSETAGLLEPKGKK